MGIDHGRFHVLVTEQLLNLTYIHTFELIAKVEIKLNLQSPVHDARV